MKTLQETKAGLECCAYNNGFQTSCSQCPYDHTGMECIDRMASDALYWLDELEGVVKKYEPEDHIP